MYVLYTGLIIKKYMRDPSDATEFIRSIDTSHHSNIRVVIPPKIWNFLNNPEKIKFTMEGKRVIIIAAEK